MRHVIPNQLVLVLCLIVGMNGCGGQEEPKNTAVSYRPAISQKPVDGISFPQGDVRRHFVAQERSLLGEGSKSRVLVKSHEKDRHGIAINEAGSFTHLAYDKSGNLFAVVSNRGEPKPDSIWLIDLNNRIKRITQSDERDTYQAGDALVTDYRRVSGIATGTESLVVTQELYDSELGNYPYSVEMEFNLLNMMPIDQLPGDKKIKSLYQLENHYSSIRDTGKLMRIFSYLTGNTKNNFYFLMEIDGEETWLRWNLSKESNKIEKLHGTNELPPDAFLVSKQGGGRVNSITGADGYIYAVEEGKGKQDPDRVIRIGDPGLSSLRKEASRATIAKFKHSELTGALAFSPKGELAVGAENAIYLLTPGPAKKPQPEKAP